MTIKIQIQRQDGVIIEVEGTSDDLLKILHILIPLQWATGTSTWQGMSLNTFCDHKYPDNWSGDKPGCMKCGK